MRTYPANIKTWDVSEWLVSELGAEAVFHIKTEGLIQREHVRYPI